MADVKPTVRMNSTTLSQTFPRKSELITELMVELSSLNNLISNKFLLQIIKMWLNQQTKGNPVYNATKEFVNSCFCVNILITPVQHGTRYLILLLIKEIVDVTIPHYK